MASTQRNLNWLRVYYLVLGGGGGFLLPFISLFYQRQGLSGTEIGLLSTFVGTAALLVAPLWGRLSDGAAAPRRWLQLELVASGVCMLLLSQQSAFVIMAGIVTLDALLSAGISPASDVLALSILSRTRAGFGSVRLFASLGWAVTSLAGGWLIERVGLIVMFVGYAAGWGTSAGLLNFMRLPPKTPLPPISRAARSSVRQSIRAVLANRPLARFGLALAVFGFMMYGLRAFEALYYKQLGAGESIVGLASMIGATVELPGLLWADRLVRRFGAVRVLRFSFALEVVRLSAVLIAPSIPTLLSVRAVGGVAYSWYVVAVLAYIQRATPERQVTTVLALFNVTLTAFIRITAAPLSGWVFDQVGAYWLYALGVLGAATAWLIMRTAGRHDLQPA